jgi:AraC-like DNA-binding protein
MNHLLQSLRLSILHIGYSKLDSNWSYNNVISPFTRLCFITNGSAVINHTNQIFNLTPGYMYLIPSYTTNSYSCDNYHEQYYVGFFEEIQPGLSIHELKRFKYEVKATLSDLQYFKRLLEINPGLEITNSTPKPHVKKPLLSGIKKNKFVSNSNYIETQGILSILLSRFIENTNIIHIEENTEGDLNKVLIYISKNLHKSLTIKELADYCNFSTDHFSRSFNKKYGMRPNKYIQSKRIERSRFLLLSTQDSLKQIAKNVGLENISYFSRTFKKITGKTPANFRKAQFSI